MIKLLDVSKSFYVRDWRTWKIRRMDAVRALSLTVSAGEVVGLLGPNGAGKTTTLRMIAGLMHADSGTICLNGYNSRSDAVRARGSVGYLSTELSVLGRFTPREYLRLFGGFYGMNSAEADRRARALLERLDLAGLADSQMEGFSTGERQKVSIARALLHDPPVVVFDEPTNGLDIFTARTVLEIIRELRVRQRAIIVSSHALPYIEKVCDRVALLFNGKLHEHGPLQDVLHRWSLQSLEDVFFEIAEREGRT